MHTISCEINSMRLSKPQEFFAQVQEAQQIGNQMEQLRLQRLMVSTQGVRPMSTKQNDLLQEDNPLLNNPLEEIKMFNDVEIVKVQKKPLQSVRNHYRPNSTL